MSAQNLFEGVILPRRHHDTKLNCSTPMNPASISIYIRMGRIMIIIMQTIPARSLTVMSTDMYLLSMSIRLLLTNTTCIGRNHLLNANTKYPIRSGRINDGIN